MKERRQLPTQEWLIRDAMSQMPEFVCAESLPPVISLLLDVAWRYDSRLVLGAPKLFREVIFSTRNLNLG